MNEKRVLIFNKKSQKIFITILLCFFCSCKSELVQSVQLINDTSKRVQIISINESNESFPLELKPTDSYILSFNNLQESLFINLNIGNERYVISTGYIQEKSNIILIITEENSNYICKLKTGSTNELCEIRKY